MIRAKIKKLIDTLYERFGTKKEGTSFFTLEEQKALMQGIGREHPRFVEFLKFLAEQDKENYFISLTERSRNIAKGQFRRAVRLYKLCSSDKPKLGFKRYST